MRPRRTIRCPSTEDTVLALESRARRCRARGEIRRAAVALREACLLDDASAARWTRLGATLAAIGRVDEARSALRQAHWLRERCGDEPRASVTARLIDRLDAFAAPLARGGRVAPEDAFRAVA